MYTKEYLSLYSLVMSEFAIDLMDGDAPSEKATEAFRRLLRQAKALIEAPDPEPEPAPIDETARAAERAAHAANQEALRKRRDALDAEIERLMASGRLDEALVIKGDRDELSYLID